MMYPKLNMLKCKVTFFIKYLLNSIFYFLKIPIDRLKVIRADKNIQINYY